MTSSTEPSSLVRESGIQACSTVALVTQPMKRSGFSLESSVILLGVIHGHNYNYRMFILDAGDLTECRVYLQWLGQTPSLSKTLHVNPILCNSLCNLNIDCCASDIYKCNLVYAYFILNLHYPGEPQYAQKPLPNQCRIEAKPWQH